MTKCRIYNFMSNPKIQMLDNLSLQEIDTEAELIPLMTPEDEEEMNNESLPEDMLFCL
jgi:ATP-dependent Lon protease